MDIYISELTEGDLSWDVRAYDPGTPRAARPARVRGVPGISAQNSVPERARPRFDAAETPKRVPEDPNRSRSQPKPLRALETGPQGAR